MPLIKSGSKKAIGKNIKTEMSHGKSRSQSIAISLETARRIRSRHPGPEKEATAQVSDHFKNLDEWGTPWFRFVEFEAKGFYHGKERKFIIRRYWKDAIQIKVEEFLKTIPGIKHG